MRPLSFLLILTYLGGAVGPGLADVLDPPAGYYSDAEGLSGSALKSVLHDIIDDHTIVPYSWPPFQDVDEAESNPAHVDLIYSNATRAKTSNGGSVGDWNREHLWPKSYGVGNDGADTSDIFNLRPSDVQVNAERGSLYFDDTNPSGSIPLQFLAPGCSKDIDSWEPRDDEKGDIARSMFYMAVRYDGSDAETNDLEMSDAPNRGTSTMGKLITLIEWHYADSVDLRERQRNQDVFDSWQGNRNPFIDHPEFVEKVYRANYPGLDRDQDGINDWWEWRRVGDLAQGPSDDGDGDKVPLLLEFVLNSDPGGDGGEGAVPFHLSSDGVATTISYRRNSLANGIAVTIEGSSDMKSGSWSTLQAAGASEAPIDEDSSMVTKVFAAAPEGYFYRLRATVAP